jgi:putative transposase
MEPKTEGERRKHRRSIRLEHRDYSVPGLYFVTICAHGRRCAFGRFLDAKLVPSRLGQIIRECWIAIPKHFSQADLHDFVIMPNHLHGVVAIKPLVGAQHRCALPAGNSKSDVKPGSLGAILRSFKAIVARRAHGELGWKGPIWQRNYFERVLRDGREFSDASSYIAENPTKWEWDRENPQFEQH